MSVSITTTKIGVEDLNISAAGSTFTRVRNVNGTTATYTPAYLNASSFPFLTANQSTITGAGWVATQPSAFAAEIAPALALPVADAATLRAITWTPTAGQTVVVKDLVRTFIWDSASTAAEVTGTVIKVAAITTGRFLSESAYLADLATLATATNGLKTATNTVVISAATAPVTYQVLKATGAALATWQDDISRGIKSATTDINTVAATAPTTGQILTATGDSAATWQDNYAIGLKSATTSVSVSAATAPTTGQALIATSDSAATWQTISSASSKATFSDTTTNAPGASATTKTVNVGTGKTSVLVFLSTGSGSAFTAANRGAIVLGTTTAGDAISLAWSGAGVDSFFQGSTALSDLAFDAAGGSYIYLRSVTYNTSTGDVDIVFYNNDASARQITYYGLVSVF